MSVARCSVRPETDPSGNLRLFFRMNSRIGSHEPGRPRILETSCGTNILAAVRGLPWTARKIKSPVVRKHCRLLATNLRGAGDWKISLREPLAGLSEALARSTSVWETQATLGFPLVPVLTRISAYQADWLRAPEHWVSPGRNAPAEAQVRSLSEHLFCLHRMPDFVHQAWLARGDLRWRDRDWFCLLAKGASWRDLPGLPRTITRRALHLAGRAPGNLSIPQGLRWGQVAACGGGMVLAGEVVRSRMVGDMTHDAHWSRLIERFAAAGERFASGFGIVADMYVELLREGREAHVERLSHVPLPELFATSRRFWIEAREALAEHVEEWKGIEVEHPGTRARIGGLLRQSWAAFLPGAGDTALVGGKLVMVRELTSGAELIAEGRRMRHCVATYTRDCLELRSAVFSIRIGEDDPHGELTVEVGRDTRRVLQARGRWNRRPDDHEHGILRLWADQHGLVPAC